MDLRIRVLLSLQRALLGEISSATRGISCAWSEQKIRICWVVEGPVSPDDQEAASRVETEVLADFADVEVQVECVRLDPPQSLAQVALPGAWVFQRREE